MLMLWVLLMSTVSSTLALDNGMALTPPMGWLTWLGFECNTDCEHDPKTCISEDLIKRTADIMVSDGYLDAGYEYLIIDDCWMETKRDSNGRLVPDRQRFKSGMKALADYIHSKGLKFGMYEDWGNYTCQGLPGLLENEKIDIKTFVEWEIDYLKVDGCYSVPKHMDKGYPALGKLLNESDRLILYSCSWPAYQEGNMEVDYEAIAKTCNIWRNWDDISKSWESVLSIMDWFGDNQDRLISHAGPGRWNDPDMLVVGHDELTIDQARAQMAVWAILAAPLIMSVDLNTIRPDYKEILLDRDVIAINQDKLGQQGRRVSHSKNLDVWVRPLSNNRYAIALVAKRVTTPHEVNITFSELQIPDEVYNVQDVYIKNDRSLILSSQTKFTVAFNNVPGVKFITLSPRKGFKSENENMKYSVNINLDVNNDIN